MKIASFDAWRVLFVIAALLILVGGPQHPGGTMVQMLHDRHWVPAHALMFAGFVALLFGLSSYRKTLTEGSATRKWARIAVYATALQSLEMALHTVAYMDGDALAAGAATPVLSTHLALAVVAYPLFAVAMIALMVVGAREGTLGSRWIVALGVLGAVGHGVAAPLTVLTDLPWARALFPALMLLALWLLLAGIMRTRVATLASSVIASRDSDIIMGESNLE